MKYGKEEVIYTKCWPRSLSISKKDLAISEGAGLPARAIYKCSSKEALNAGSAMTL